MGEGGFTSCLLQGQSCNKSTDFLNLNQPAAWLMHIHLMRRRVEELRGGLFLQGEA